MLGQLRACLPPGPGAYTWLRDHQRPLVTAVGATAGTVVVIKLVRSWVNRSRLQQRRKEKLRACQKAIELLSQRVLESEVRLVNIDLLHVYEPLTDG